MRRLLRLDGAAAQSRYTTVDGGRIHHLEAGGGPVVVLLQGAGGGAANWFRLLRPLSRTHRVLAPDLPGFGLSDPVPPRAPLGRNTASVIRRWLRAVDVDDCAVVATSFGGLVALRLAQMADSPIRRLVLMDSVGLGRELPLLLRLAVVPGLARLGVRPSRRGTAWMFRTLLTTHAHRIDAERRAAIIDYLYRCSLATHHASLARAVRRFVGLRGQREVISDDELGRLDLPVLVTWGEDDRFLPVRHGRRAAARLPHGRLEVIPLAGHSPNWEAPDAVLGAVLPFLES